jgi:hypothetical protein
MTSTLSRQLQSSWPACIVAAASLMFLLLSPAVSAPRATDVPDEDSDWRAAVTGKTADISDPQAHTQHRELPAANFTILGVSLGPGEITQAAQKIGKTNALAMGDGAFTSSQACYVPSGKANDIHLIFAEDGEHVGASIILFGAGHSWNGTPLCAKSPLISRAISTANGLRLGLTPAEVQAILGQPSKAAPDRLEYILQVRKKTSAAKLNLMRQAQQYMSDAEFHRSYDFYNTDEHIVARFSGSKLNYLSVTRIQTYP